MPQISKVRIVNFRYNDGKRLIADELYDFTGKKADTAKNVLMNLANGGGKSVLVQLMMQPMIPKAKVAGRKIESFFTKSSDHCYVVLEWIKDNSSEKLMTGIAMAASDSANAEDMHSRGLSVKYYTFYSDYSNYAGQYNIQTLPLSMRGEGNKYVPAEYDAIRLLARKSNGLLNYYASDDSKQWQHKLWEYGISYTEWRLIEQLNSEEGGLSKFFGDFKTSDAVIDRLLIPRIEEQSLVVGSKEDSSLATMMISFSRKYGKQQETIRERDYLCAFSDSLKLRKAEVDELWEVNDHVHTSLNQLFGFADALDRQIEALISEQNQVTQAIERSKETIKHIDYEQASYRYYEALDAFTQAQEVYQQAEFERSEIHAQLSAVQKRILLLECANYHGKLVSVQAEMDALRNAIAEKEQGEQAGSQLASLKYSARLAIENALEIVKTELKRIHEKLDVLRASVDAVNAKKADAQRRRERIQHAYDTESGRLEAAHEETDKALDKIGFELIRRLDGSYGEDEIHEQKSERDLSAEKVKKQWEERETRLHALRQESADIPQSIADLKLENGSTTAVIQSIGASIEEYDHAEDKVLSICKVYNLDPEGRFTGNALSYLQEELQKERARAAHLVYQISIAEEFVHAAERSTIHVPKAVIDYLNESGVAYQTCEHYLLSQVESGTMTVDRCEEILQHYPAAAFGILLSDAEKERLFSYGREAWLPAMVPLFTPAQMKNVLTIREDRPVAIAFYSKEYFASKEDFLSKKQHELEVLLGDQVRCNEKQQILSQQIEDVRSFSYRADWRRNEVNKRNNLLEKCRQIEIQIDKLSERKAALETEMQQLCSEVQEYKEQIVKYERFCEDYVDFLNRIRAEGDLAASVSNLEKRCAEAKDSLRAATQDAERMSSLLKETEQEDRALQDKLSRLESAHSEVGDCAEAECVEGDWNYLYEQYQQLQKAQSSELAQLKDQFQKQQARADEYRAEITKRECSEDQYTCVTYSKAEETAKRDQEKVLLNSADAHDKQVRTLSENKAKAEGRKEETERQLLNFAPIPLEKSAIGGDFEGRIRLEKENCSIYEERLQTLSKTQKSYERVCDRIGDILSNAERSGTIHQVTLDSDCQKQFKNLKEQWQQYTKVHEKKQSEVRQAFDQMRSAFAGTFSGSDQAVGGLCQLISNDAVPGDRYYTLSEQIAANLKTIQLQISKIETDLAEFDHCRDDLIRQCCAQGQRIFEGLRQIMRSSRVKVYSDKANQQMLKLDIPEEVDPNIARNDIAAEIDQGTKELSAKILASSNLSDAELRKEADKIVGSQKLFRKYIGRDTLILRAYKIDRNPDNAGYRDWRTAQISNSGAEKFVIYFAVILSLMNYARNGFGGINDRTLTSTLILDNPFGPISSAHVLEPMFAIAKHFRVQMICLSDISKQDILNCFDLVIKAVIKSRALSKVELLIHEENEELEHGFYRAEQMSLL